MQKAMLGEAAVNGGASAGTGIGDELIAGGSWRHRWDKSASCAWNSMGCKI